jgi:hypothetical protein
VNQDVADNIAEEDVPSPGCVKPAQKPEERHEGAGKSVSGPECSGPASASSGIGARVGNSGTGVGKSCFNCGKFYPDYEKSGFENEKSGLDSRKSEVDGMTESGAEKLEKDCDIKSGSSVTDKSYKNTVDKVGLDKEAKELKQKNEDEKADSLMMDVETSGHGVGTLSVGTEVMDVEKPLTHSKNVSYVEQTEQRESVDCHSDVRGPDSIFGVVPVSSGATGDQDGARNDFSSYSGKGKRPIGRKTFFKKRAKSSTVPGTSAGDTDDNVTRERGNRDVDMCALHGSGSEGSGKVVDGEVQKGVDKSGEPMKSFVGASGIDGGTNTHGIECVSEETGVSLNETENILVHAVEGSDNKFSGGTVSEMDSVQNGSGEGSNRKGDVINRSREPGYPVEATGDLRSNNSNGGVKIKNPSDSHASNSAHGSHERQDRNLLNSSEQNATPMDGVDCLPVGQQSGNKSEHELTSQDCDEGSPKKVTNSDCGRKSDSLDMEQFDSPVTPNMVASGSSSTATSKSTVSPSLSQGDTLHTCEARKSPQTSGSPLDDTPPSVKSDELSTSNKSLDEKAAENMACSTPSGSENNKLDSKHSTACKHVKCSDLPASHEQTEARKTVGTQTSYNAAGLYAGPGPSGSADPAPPVMPVEPVPDVQASPSSAESTPRRRDIPVFRCLSDVDDEELEEDARQVRHSF